MKQVAGHVDGLEGHYLLGWAIAEPDLESCRVEVTDEDGILVGRGRATRTRTDLSSLGRNRTNFAFRIPVQLDKGRLLRVHAYGIELPGSPVAIGTGRWDGVLSLNNGVASGWVLERTPSSTSGPRVQIRDERGLLIAEAVTEPDTSHNDPRFMPARFEVLLGQGCFGRGEIQLFASVDGVIFARTTANLRLDGFLDAVSPHRCAGWLLSPDSPNNDFNIEIFCNGRSVAIARAVGARDDLKDLYPNSWRRGFDVPLNADVPVDQLCEISLRLSGTDLELFGGPFVVGKRLSVIGAARNAARLSHGDSYSLDIGQRSILQAALTDFIHKHRRATDLVVLRSAGKQNAAARRHAHVIIPVYRGVEITRECIVSVLQHRNTEPYDVVIVNDCSPEPQMAAMLRMFANESSVVILTNESNLGFVRSVNRALERFSSGDVILLNSDTRVFSGWFAELSAVAHASPEIGTVTALSNNATIFSYPHPSRTVASLDDCDWEELASVLLRHNAGLTIDVPTGHGFCLLIKHELLNRIGRLDEKYGRGYGEENDFCGKAADLGFRNVAAGGVLVEHRENVSFGAERAVLWEQNRLHLESAFPEYMQQIMAYEERDDLRIARWVLDEYRLAKFGRTGSGFVLTIRNWLGGGSDTAVKDLNQTFDSSWPHITLTSRADGYISLTADQPAIFALFAPGEEERLFDLLAAIKVRLVVAHQLLGLRKEFLDRFAEWIKAQPSVSYLHDFYAFCPRVNLIDATGQFCDIPNVKICERCVKAGGSHEASRLTQLSVVDHRALFTRIFTNIGHVISPSLNTEHYFRKVMPKVDILTIPHPQTLWQFPAQPRLGSASNIVLLGAIGSHKGSKVLLDIANRARLTHPHLHFHVVGYTNRDTQLMAFGNVSITGEYQAAELRRLIDTTGGRFALFLHCWPETFSYALTEAVAAGLIPLVPDVGAPAERVKAAGFGRVYPFTSDAARVLEALDLLINEPASLHDNGPGPQAFAPVPSTVDTTRTLFAGLMAGHSGNARRAPRRSNATAGAASPLLRVG